MPACASLGDTFRSGADQALLYESCVAIGEPQRFQTIEARSNTLELIGLVAMMCVGGVIVETSGFGVAWIVEALLAACGIGVACSMTSPPPVPLPETASSEGCRRPAATLSVGRHRKKRQAPLVSGR